MNLELFRGRIKLWISEFLRQQVNYDAKSPLCSFLFLLFLLPFLLPFPFPIFSLPPVFSFPFSFSPSHLVSMIIHWGYTGEKIMFLSSWNLWFNEKVLIRHPLINVISNIIVHGNHGEETVKSVKSVLIFRVTQSEARILWKKGENLLRIWGGR